MPSRGTREPIMAPPRQREIPEPAPLDLPVSADPRGEFPFNVDDYLFHLLVAVGRMRDTHMDRQLRDIGLNVGRHRTLAVIYSFQPCTMTKLADVSSIDRTTLTRIVDQLVEQELVDRVKSPVDRRQVTLAMTPLGGELYARSCHMVAQQNRHALEGIPDAVKRSLVRGAQMLVANLSPNARVTEELLTLRPADGEGVERDA